MSSPETAPERVTAFGDRRREPRDSQPAAAKVQVWQDRSLVEFDAVMIDSSSGGLAIRHWRKDLPIGRTVRISLAPDDHFAAQVVWNWSLGPVVISGLERVKPGIRGAFSTQSEFRIGAGRPAAVRRSLSWIFAAFAALLIAAGWYFGTRM